ncbi:MAG: type II toxin-antitoxin system RelE/ParE family toxin [Cardiobacteriaceae bacterium]|nr:type II toxin-antitoxin system RelE/ParE family toxin [Cardiobacteriaceae bacterium]
MERKIIYSDRALADLRRLRRFLLFKNDKAANRAASAIRSKVNQLRDFPHIGKKAQGSKKIAAT